MARDVDDSVRRLVAERARRRCEYCLVHEDSTGFPHEIDHIISRKHAGSSGIPFWPDDPILRSPARLVGSTFQAAGFCHQAANGIDEVTTRMLRLNAAERVIERRLMQALGQYPRE